MPEVAGSAWPACTEGLSSPMARPAALVFSEPPTGAEVPLPPATSPFFEDPAPAPDLSLSAIDSRFGEVVDEVFVAAGPLAADAAAVAEPDPLIESPGTCGAEVAAPDAAEVLLIARPGTGDGDEEAEAPVDPAEVATAGLSRAVAEEPTAPATLFMVPIGTGLTV